MIKNRRLVLAARPQGLIKGSDFRLEELDVPALSPGEFLIRTHYLSLAPVMKFYMLDGAGIENPLPIGGLMRGRGVGQVIESKNPKFEKGDFVQGKFGWQEYVVGTGSPSEMMYRVNQNTICESTALGVLGITGFTAYFGLYGVGELKSGDNVLVSAAAGGVGCSIGSLCKLKGARAIGLTSTDEKKRLLTQQLNYHAAINYKTEDVIKRIDALFPNGIDVYFDNVGGEILDMALSRLRQYARVVCCGRISTYRDDLKKQDYEMKNWHMIGATRSKMQGFFIYDYEDQFPIAEREITQWIEQGKLSYQEDILEGLEQMPEALNRLFEGKNTGKQLVKIYKPTD